MKKLSLGLALIMSAMVAFAGCAPTTPSQTQEPSGVTAEGNQSLAQAKEAYLQKVDVEYSYNLANKIAEIMDNPKLGYRTAGSPSELATGDMLKAEMERIGLKNVTKDEFTLDTWTFEKADLTFTKANGETHLAVMGGYQAQFVTDGFEAFTIVDGGEGTPADLEGIDVKDKFILVNINQRDNWWINYPALQAQLLGAKGIIAVQDGGYSEVSPDALNAQDICAPANAVAFSLSQTDAAILREAMAATGKGEMEIQLDAVSKVGLDGKSYNIVGSIPGRNPDRMIMLSAHYDSYFEGFQDDNAAIALMMGIAKGLVDSGYEPENTIMFVAMAAEEWGVSNTRYDWSTGAYNQIFRIHPEWQGKVMANINFELPAMEEGDSDQIRSSYELKTYLEAFGKTVPEVEGIFPNGVEVIVPTQTWSDDFSLSIAGIPAAVTALRGDFSKTHYHTQFDDKNTYSEKAFLYHHNLYGMLVMEYDHMIASPLDFTTRLETMKDTIDSDVFARANADEAGLVKALDTAITSAKKAWDKVNTANLEYKTALEAKDTAKAQELKNKYEAMAREVLAAFRFAEDNFVRLTWEDVSIFPHENYQNNLDALYGAMAALETGDTTTAIDDYLWLVDNNFYAYDWSKEVFNYYTDYVLNQPADRLMWGAGRVQGHIDLFDVIASLGEKYDTTESVEAELAVITNYVKAHEADMVTVVAQQIADIEALTARLDKIAA